MSGDRPRSTKPGMARPAVLSRMPPAFIDVVLAFFIFALLALAIIDFMVSMTTGQPALIFTWPSIMQTNVSHDRTEF